MFRRRGVSTSLGCDVIIFPVIPAKAGIQDEMKNYYVYILCNKRNGTLYTGMTSDLVKRIYEHKKYMVNGFSKKYNIQRLVWFKVHETARSAIKREKQIKKWKRIWKIELIEKQNPDWDDLYESICW